MNIKRLLPLRYDPYPILDTFDKEGKNKAAVHEIIHKIAP